MIDDMYTEVASNCIRWLWTVTGGGEWERNRLKGKGKVVPSLAMKA